MSSPRFDGSECPVSSPIRMKHLKSTMLKSKASHVPERKDSKQCHHTLPPGHTLCLTDKKRASLLQIKKREELKAIRYRLRGILIQKLVQKMGKRKEPLITKHVDEFVRDKKTVSAQDLMDLEEAIRADKSMPTPKNTPRSNEMPSLNGGEPQTDSNSLLGGTRTGICPQCGKMNCKFNDCSAPIPKGNEWEALQVYQALAATQKQQQEDAQRLRKQKELQRALDQQMKEQEERRKRERFRDDDYINHVNRDVEKFKEENTAAHEKLMRQHAQTRKIWEDQLEAERKAREMHREELMRQERLDAEMAADALAREKNAIQKKKQAEAAANAAIMRENEVNDKRKAEEKRREQELDIKLAQDYADKLDREDKARQDAFNRRVEALDKFAKWADEGPAGKGRREEERKMEELLLKEQLKKEARDLKREKDDKHAIIERKRLMAEQNLKLIEERNRLAEEERLKDKEYAEKARQVGESHKQAERDRRRAEQEKQQKYGRVLQAQIQTTKNSYESMTATERSINKDALNSIQFDPAFHSRVYHRLRMRPNTARPSSGSNTARKQQAWA